MVNDNDSRKELKVTFPPLDMILTIKKLSEKDQEKLVKLIKNKIETSDVVDLLEVYKTYIKTAFKEPNKIFEKLDVIKKEEDASTLTTGEYEALISLLHQQLLPFYPEFDLQIILQDFNESSAFLDEAIVEVDNHKEDEAKKLIEAKKKLNILNLNKINELRKFFNKNVIDQKEAVEALINLLKRIATGLDQRGSVFFVGPSGTGKTKLSKMFSEVYYNNFLKINCGEYQSQHDYVKLVGAPPGYIGHTGENLLKTKSDQSNAWVFLFDEIEKASPKFRDFLLNLLDEGRVSDNSGNELDFSKSIFLFTSNQGVDELRGETMVPNHKPFDYADHKEDIIENVKKNFTTAFIGRIDELVFFNPLKKETLKKIVDLELASYPIMVTDDLSEFLIKKGYDQKYGARHVENAIRDYIKGPLADALLNNRIPKEGDLYEVEVEDDKVFIVNTKKLRLKNTRRASSNIE